jgi:hypothetical protein
VKWNRLLAEHREENHCLALEEDESVTRRNGGARDLGADVIAHTPDGRKIVFQCKHRRPGSRPIGSQAMQTLNGTARPVHQADIVIAITNGSFTTPARQLAADQNIHLLWGHSLRKWTTGGTPLLDVLGLHVAAPDRIADPVRPHPSAA